MSRFFPWVFVGMAFVHGCKSNSDGSGLKEVTKDGFKYDRVTVKVVDSEGKAIVGLPAMMSSYRWKFEVVNHGGLFPAPGRGWVWETSENQNELAITDNRGVAERTGLFLKARQGFAGKPAGITLSSLNTLNILCPNRTLAGSVNLDLSVISQNPADTNPNTGASPMVDVGCSLTLGANEDVYQVLELTCKSSLTIAQIDAEVVRIKGACN